MQIVYITRHAILPYGYLRIYVFMKITSTQFRFLQFCGYMYIFVYM